MPTLNVVRGAAAVYYRELLILRRRLTRLVPSWSVSPTLYLVAFAYAVGRHGTVDGRPYVEFLLPGLVAMSSMTQSFAIASENQHRPFLTGTIFEEIQAAPVSSLAYAAGEVAAGMTRALGRRHGDPGAGARLRGAHGLRAVVLGGDRAQTPSSSPLWRWPWPCWSRATPTRR